MPKIEVSESADDRILKQIGARLRKQFGWAVSKTGPRTYYVNSDERADLGELEQYASTTKSAAATVTPTATATTATATGYTYPGN